MADVIGTGEGKKADSVADAINKIFSTLTIRCAGSDGIKDYLHIGVIGYGAQVGPAFAGTLAGRPLVPISEVGNSPARLEQRNKKVADGAGGIIDQPIRFPVWFDSIANGATPMSQALGQAKIILVDWLSQHPNCFPPIVFNFTDGEATDGDPSAPAAEIRNLKSNDGEVLLFNVHLSSQQGAPIEYPNNSEVLPDKFAQQLFQMSSQLPAAMVKLGKNAGLNVSEASRGFVYNAGIVSVIQFLDMGTAPANKLR
jgi:hypothetical protein